MWIVRGRVGVGGSNLRLEIGVVVENLHVLEWLPRTHGGGGGVSKIWMAIYLQKYLFDLFEILI